MMNSVSPSPSDDSPPARDNSTDAGLDATPTLLQFSTRDMLIIVGLLSVMVAILAPLVRHLSSEGQWNVAWQMLILSLVVGGILVYTVYRRRAVESLLGAPERRFTNPATRWLNYALGFLLLLIVMATIGFGALSNPAGRKTGPLTAVNNFWVLYVVGTFWVRRVVFQIDKAALEVCPRGLLYGGFEALPWDEIARYSWSSPVHGTSKNRQLNLFLTKRLVMNLKVPSAWVYELDEILRARMGGGRE